MAQTLKKKRLLGLVSNAGGGGLPAPPEGFAYVIYNGAYVIYNGAYVLMGI